MAQASSLSGGVAIKSSSLQSALAHPAVARLAGLLKIDLSDETQLNAVLALTKNTMDAKNIRAPPHSEMASHGFSAALARVSTPANAAEAIKAYEDMDRL